MATPPSSRSPSVASPASLPNIEQGDPNIQVQLTEPLWKQFYDNTTEMIVTKAGRNLFPKVTVRIRGLHPHSQYIIMMRLERHDKKKYKYTSCTWLQDEDEDSLCAPRVVEPPIQPNEGGPRTGAQWEAQDIEFINFKITNNAEEAERSRHNSGTVIKLLVSTLRTYVPVIYIRLIDNFSDVTCRVVPLVMARFIAVTAYQNERMKGLKTQHNPFARGVRDGYRNTSPEEGRKRSAMDEGGPQMKHSPAFPPAVHFAPMASPAFSSAPMCSPVFPSAHQPLPFAPAGPFPSPPTTDTENVPPFPYYLCQPFFQFYPPSLPMGDFIAPMGAPSAYHGHPWLNRDTE